VYITAVVLRVWHRLVGALQHLEAFLQGEPQHQGPAHAAHDGELGVALQHRHRALGFVEQVLGDV
jgi:hypothetical protein